MRRFSGEVTNGLKHYQPEIQQKTQGTEIVIQTRQISLEEGKHV